MKQQNIAKLVVLAKIVEKRIFLIRGHRVMVDTDLADLYGVLPKVLNQAVKRNDARFPEDFMFQLTKFEWDGLLRSQFVTSKTGSGGRRYAPFVFTENGVAMLSSILNSETAIQTNIVIMRTFNRIRDALKSQSMVLKRLDALEKTVGTHGEQIRHVFQAIRELVAPDLSVPKRRIGIHIKN